MLNHEPTGRRNARAYGRLRRQRSTGLLRMDAFAVRALRFAVNSTTQGFAYTNSFTCDGSPHTVDMDVTPCNYQCGPPFRTGSAFAEAALAVCHTVPNRRCTDFEQTSTSQAIRITKS